MKSKLKTVFMGTPEFAVPSLEALHRETELALVITQPDRPVGRGRKLEPPPVKRRALELGLEVVQPKVVKGKRFASTIEALEPDVLVTAAFGRILGPSLLAVPRKGCLNVHASLLPLYRGAAPINWAIIDGRKETGVSIMAMEEGLDTGAVFHVVKTDIRSDETAGELTTRLADMGAGALTEVLARIDAFPPVEQDHSLATHAPILKKSHGVVDWTKSAFLIDCHLRGVHPWPGGSTLFGGVVLKIHRAKIAEEDGGAGEPGEVLGHSPDGVRVRCAEGVLLLTELQLPGKKRLDARSFFAGQKIEQGTILGQ